MKKILLGILAFLLVPVLSWAITITADTVKVDGTIRFEGATYDSFDTILTVVDPTATNTITFPDSSGTVSLADAWTELSDTPSSISSGFVVQGGSSGSLEFGQALDTTDSPSFGGLTVETDTLFVGSTKVGMGTTVIPHGGLGGALLALEGTDNSITAGPHIQFTTATDDHPLLQILPFTHDDISLNFDAYWNGSIFQSSDVGSNFQITKLSDLFEINYASGVALGTQVSFNVGIALTAGGFVGIGTGTPESALHVDGSVQIGANSADTSNRLIINAGGNIVHTFGPITGGSGFGRFQIINNVDAVVEASNDSGGYFTRNNTGTWAAIIGSSSTVGGLKFFTGGTSTLQVYDGLSATLAMTIDESQDVTMAGDLQVTGAFIDSLGSPGTSGQILSSTITGTDWVDDTIGNVTTSDTLTSLTMLVGNGAEDIQAAENTARIFVTSDFQEIQIQSEASGLVALRLLDSTQAIKAQLTYDDVTGFASFLGNAPFTFMSTSTLTVQGNTSLTLNSGTSNMSFEVIATEEMELSSSGLSLTSGNTYQINSVDVLSATTLGSAVINSSLTSVGTLSSLAISGDLTVTGTINNATLDDDATLKNLLVGASAGASITVASQATAIGHQALATNISGSDGTAVGFKALFLSTGANNVGIGAGTAVSLSTASKVTAVGTLALSNVTTGDENTALGYKAGGGITTGTQNTIIGANVTGLLSTLSNNIILADGAGVIRLQFDSSGDGTIGGNVTIGGNLTVSGTINNATVSADTTLFNLTVGASAGGNFGTTTNNVAVGEEALSGLVTSGDNTAVGYQAAKASTSGGLNTAVGSQAMLVATTAADTTAIGANALIALTTGDANTGIGSFSLASLTSGNQNTSIGDFSLLGNVLGSKNTVVGQNSGVNIAGAALTGENSLFGYNTGLGITTGVQNTILGANVTGLTSTLSNNIILADGAGVVRLQFDSSGDGVMGGDLLIGTSGSNRVDIIGSGGTETISETFAGNLSPRWALGRDTFESGGAGLALGGVNGYAYIGTPTGSTGDQLIFSTNGSNTLGTGGTFEKMRLDSSGNLGIGVTSMTERFEVDTDTDISGIIGRARVGYIGLTDWAGFAHLDLAQDGSNYSLASSNAGRTLLNSMSGQNLELRVGNSTKLFVDGTTGFIGIGVLSSPDTKLHILSTAADTTAVVTLETTGTNAGETAWGVGSADPNANRTGAGGALHIRDDGALSNLFFSKEATTGTEWQPVSILPTTVNQLFSTAEYEDLGTASVITTGAVTRSLRFHATVTSSTRHTITSPSSELQFIDPTEGNRLNYTGSLALITSAAGGDVTSRNAALFAGTAGTPLFNYLGVGVLPSVDIIEIVQSSNLAQWDLGTIGRLSTGELGPVVKFKDTNIISTTDPLILDSVAILEVTSNLFDDSNDTGSGGPLFSIKDSSYKEGRAVFLTNGGRLYSGESLVRVDAGLPSTYRVEVIDSLFIINSGGAIFDTSGSTGAFTVVANNSISATTISGVTDSSGVASFTVATAPLVGSLATVSGFTTNTDYNTTGIVTARTATTFEIDYVAFGTTETGSYLVTGVTVTATAHGLSTTGTGVTLDTTESTQYDGGFLIYNIQTNSFDVPGTFDATEAGTWSTEGLDQTDPRVRAFNNPGTDDSHSIAGGFVNSNPTATGTIVNNVFTDMVFGTSGSALTEISTAEGWKQISDVNGLYEYAGLDPFDGFITFDFTVESSGGTVDFRFKWMKTSSSTLTSTGISFTDLDPDTISHAGNGFLTAGFVAEDTFTVSGSSSNDGSYIIASVTAGTITLAGPNAQLTNESAGSSVTVAGTFTNLPDAVEALVAVGSDAQSVTKTFPLAMVIGEQIKPQITRNSGSSAITTTHATIYATNPL